MSAHFITICTAHMGAERQSLAWALRARLRVHSKIHHIANHFVDEKWRVLLCVSRTIRTVSDTRAVLYLLCTTLSSIVKRAQTVAQTVGQPHASCSSDLASLAPS